MNSRISRKIKKQLFVLFSGGHIGAPERDILLHFQSKWIVFNQNESFFYWNEFFLNRNEF